MDLASAASKVANPIIVTGDEHRFLALEQIRETHIDVDTLLLEPEARNTAPALTLAALTARANGQDPMMVVSPSDQAVKDEAAFSRALHEAVLEATDSNIVILGIEPDGPETGYGYIQTVVDVDQSALPVKRFVEKPSAHTAQKYLSEGGYYWNAGIFVLRASVWLRAIGQFRPDILNATTTAWKRREVDVSQTTSFVRPGKVDYEGIPPDSIDCAVLERCVGSEFAI